MLTRVGRNTPMGEMLRRYWIPACLSSDVAEADCDPFRVRLLGEDLVAFRDDKGRVGLMEEHCPHRGASLFFGRNEQGGLRCLYHGWKMDVDGNVVDTPCEPATLRVRHAAYPVVEQGDVIWAYMGPRDKMPTFPNFQWTQVPKENRVVRKVYEECNWVQALEGSVDIPHFITLHSGRDIMQYPDEQRHLREAAPHQEAHDTRYGFCYIATWPAKEDPERLKSVQIKTFAVPFHSYITGGGETGHAGVHLFVPSDDENNWYYEIRYDSSKPVSPHEPDRYLDIGVDLDSMGRKIKRSLANNYLQDRAAMRAKRSFSGLDGRPHEDIAMLESMGSIYDRSKEHLGLADLVITKMRRRLLDSLDIFMEGGDPLGLDASIPYDRIGVLSKTVPVETRWQDMGAEIGEDLR